MELSADFLSIGRGSVSGHGWSVFLERELLSRFLANLTVKSLQAEKERRSTWRGLRVDTKKLEFRQTPRGRGFSLLEFYSLFKYFTNV